VSLFAEGYLSEKPRLLTPHAIHKVYDVASAGMMSTANAMSATAKRTSKINAKDIMRVPRERSGRPRDYSFHIELI
jgi:hypothetical protein